MSECEGTDGLNSSSPICSRNVISTPSRPFYALLVGEITDFQETNDEDERRVKGDIGLYHSLRKSQATRASSSSSTSASASSRTTTPAVTENNIVHLKDEEATKRNAEKALVQLLQLATTQQESEPRDNSAQGRYDLLFYFGGHGQERHFDTYGDGDVWTHEQLLDTLERHYRGHGVVWILLDCCYAGNFYRAVQDRRVASAWRRPDPNPSSSPYPTYVCVMSTPPDAVADDDWTFTEALVYSIERGHTTGRALEYLSDRLAHDLQDLLTVYVHHRDDDGARTERGSGSGGGLLAPFFRDNGCDNGDCNPIVLSNRTPSQLPTVIPRNGSRVSTTDDDNNDSKQMVVQIGDFVFAKWKGGETSNAASDCSSQYVFPLWFPALVIAVDGDDDDEQMKDAHHSGVTVEFHDPSSSYKWIGSVQRSQLLHKSHFNHTEPPSNDDYKHPWSASCSDLQLKLASERRYITFEIPAGTRLRARWTGDRCLYDASVPCVSHVPWRDLVVDDRDEGNAESPVLEACVPVVWDDEDRCSIVMLCQCVVSPDTVVASTTTADRREGGHIDDGSQQSAQSVVARVNRWMDNERYANQIAGDSNAVYRALLCSLFSSGKTLHKAEYLLDSCDGGEHNYREDLEIQCLWEEEDRWYTAQGVNYFQVGQENDGSRKQEEFLRALSKHCDFEDVAGRYCVMRWDDNHTFSLLPEKFLRQTHDE